MNNLTTALALAALASRAPVGFMEALEWAYQSGYDRAEAVCLMAVTESGL